MKSPQDLHGEARRLLAEAKDTPMADARMALLKRALALAQESEAMERANRGTGGPALARDRKDGTAK
jgi:hypothetical protein